MAELGGATRLERLEQRVLRLEIWSGIYRYVLYGLLGSIVLFFGSALFRVLSKAMEASK